jgi:parallel beta-helix repeat protein
MPFQNRSTLQLSTSPTQSITSLMRWKSSTSGARMYVALLLVVVSFWPSAQAETGAVGNAPSSCPASTPPNASVRHLYVSTAGSDAERGSANAPFRTIQRASRAATAGTTIHVGPGAYKETITSTASGTAGMPIRYVSEPPGAAVIRPSRATDTIWSDSGDYVAIEGFNIDGSESPDVRIGIFMAGSHVYVKANEVHHIVLNGANDSRGGAGIVLGGGYYNKIDQNAIGNHVHHVGTATSNRLHGVYHQSTGSIINNVIHSNPGSIGIVLWHDAKNITIANNTVVDNGLGISVGSGDWYHGPIPADHVTAVNNLVYGNQSVGIQEHGLTGIHNVYRNNLAYGNGLNWRLQNGIRHEGTISADPQFLNYRGGDYRLRATSPANGAGVALGKLVCHFDQMLLPGAARNIGAEGWRPAQAPD